MPTNAGCINQCSSTVQEFEIPFGSTLTFNVTSVAAPQDASIANHGLSDVLTILDDEAFINHLVPLQNTASGAVLQLAPSPLAMAPAPANTTSTAGGFFYMWNTGTQPANGLTFTVGGTDAADFVLPAAAFSVPQLANIGLNDTHQSPPSSPRQARLRSPPPRR